MRFCAEFETLGNLGDSALHGSRNMNHVLKSEISLKG
jgi:hypothetical protein